MVVTRVDRPATRPRGGGTRRLRIQRITLPAVGNPKSKPPKRLRIADPSVAHSLPTDTCKTDPDLALVNVVWDQLPVDVRADIIAKVRAAI